MQSLLCCHPYVRQHLATSTWPAGPGAAEGSTQPPKARKRKDEDNNDDDPWHKFGDQDLEAVSPISPGSVRPKLRLCNTCNTLCCS